MKLIINIPDEIYSYVNTQWRDIPKIDSPISIICNAIIDGTPLPKGHNENNDYADCDQFVCSECGIELQDWHRVERDIDDGDITYHEYTFRYCPNCGTIIEAEEG